MVEGDVPDTIVLIHGMFVTPRSFELWQDRYSRAGYRVMVPAWPGIEREVEAVRAYPAFLGTLRVERILSFYQNLLRDLDRPPILMGHSTGGAILQLLLDRGFGAAGVAIHSLGVKGVYTLPVSQLRAVGKFLLNPANAKRPLELSAETFHYAFCNTLSRAESDTVYNHYYIPGVGPVVFQSAFANFSPTSVMKVRFDNPERAPLLFISGSEDNLCPPAIQKENVRRYKAGKTEYRLYPGRSHYTLGQPGWEAVADDALAWARENCKPWRREAAVAPSTEWPAPPPWSM